MSVPSVIGYPYIQAGVVSTTDCLSPNLVCLLPPYLRYTKVVRQMSHIREILPPPDLSYPPDELGLGPQHLSRETGRTQLENNRFINPLVPEKERAAFLIIVDRLIPQKNDHSMCAMCGYVLNP